MNYLIHASLLVAGCFVYYYLLLRKETHFQLNRWVLLGCLVSSLTLPLLTVPAAWSLQRRLAATETVGTTTQPSAAATDKSAVKKEAKAAKIIAGNKELAAPADPELSPTDPEEARQPATTQKRSDVRVIDRDASFASAVDWWKVAWWVYLGGLLIFGLNFLIQFGQIVLRSLRNPGHDLGTYRLVEINEDAAPYSFWNRIFLNPERYDPDTFHQIFQHEQIHVAQKHSIDLILAELLVVFLWFNPFAWLYRKAIEDNLEFLTDAEMLRIGNDPERYQLSLVKVAVPNFPNGLVASYNQNFLEKRITMMKAKKSSVRSGWKYLTLFSLLLVSVLQFNAVAQAPVPPAPPAPPAPSAPVAVTPPAPPTRVLAAPNPAPAPAPAPAPVPMPAPVAPPGGWEMVVPEVVPVPTPTPVPTPVLHMNLEGDWELDKENGFNSWTALIEGDEVCFQFMSRGRRNHNNWNYQNSRCFALADLGTLPRGGMGEFSLQRQAGTLTMKGVFEGNDGVGNFTFVPAAEFVATLDRAGYGTYKDQELFIFFMADMNDEYLSYLKTEGYNPDHQKLLQLAIFYDDLAELKTRTETLEKLGYRNPKLSKLIKLQIHGVDEEYMEELASAGFPDLSLDDMIKAKIHGLSSSFVTEMNQMGFRNLSFDRLTQLAIHGISTEYVNELKELGYTDLNPEEVLKSKIHGVSTERIAEWQEAGFSDLTLSQAQKMAIHGVDADLVRTLANFGFTDLSVDQAVQAKIHGMSERWLNAFKSTGLEMTDLNQLKNAFIHGVDPELIKGMRSIGYDDLGLNDFVKAKIHGISPEYAASFREVGFKDIPFNTLIKLRIHGVTADFIKDRLREGRDLNDYLKMKMHGL